ncbi:HNH endonuclease [Caminicella sporogenes]|uniref:HNH endonuclease n=1 Tax=Caminicella sporogenes TaxID=166485 RepID=UPI0025403919|nr:HNH endonuclease signature motif containing protein [Caminicella sporogenes]WIF95133.1 HNH endonuclease signature motif containing protein [Caminicella sporogenes]
MPKKICNEYGCNKIIDYTEIYCKEHKKINDQRKKQRKKERLKNYDNKRKNSKEWKFYKSKEWLYARRAALVRDNYLCQHCLKNNRITLADMVHHIIPIKEDFSKRLQLSNLISLCNSCHEKIHRKKGGGVKNF